MMRVEIADATAALAHYARKARESPVLVTQRGKPVAALMAVTAEDWEDLVVGSHPGFLRLIEQSRQACPASRGIPLEEIKRKYGIKTRRPSSRRRPKR